MQYILLDCKGISLVGKRKISADEFGKGDKSEFVGEVLWKTKLWS